MSLIDDIKFDAHGLVPAIAQDAGTGCVLMMAWMNDEAVRRSIDTGYAHYYSRSRKKQWKKGESSGHVQKSKPCIWTAMATPFCSRSNKPGPPATPTARAAFSVSARMATGRSSRSP